MFFVSFLIYATLTPTMCCLFQFTSDENTSVESVKEEKENEKVPSPTALMQSRVVSNRRSSIIRAKMSNKK
jgi:hypothetical protein